ncbi:hypothetical protein ACSTS3_19550 [Aquimarina muelleri]|uniref:hypothetical protein n=1 Tax=Aquimarina muelleri TaxID=279356 RepID=UPI003F688A8C
MQVTKDQIKVLHAVLPIEVITDKEAKQEFIYSFTNDSKRTSTKQLSFEEANQALISLGAKPFKRSFVRPDKWQIFNSEKKSHMNILSILKQMEWQYKSDVSNRYFADMVRFGNWLQTKAPIKKPLNEMNANEVSITIVVLEKMVNQYNQNQVLISQNG